MRQGMQKGANFCTNLPLFYHTSWLNQQNPPKLQMAVYFFLFLIDQLFSSQQNLFRV